MGVGIGLLAVWGIIAWFFYAPTTPISTATLASEPGAGAPPIVAVFISSISAQWTAGAPPNPAGTRYVLEASTAPDFTGTSDVSSNTANIADFALERHSSRCAHRIISLPNNNGDGNPRVTRAHQMRPSAPSPSRTSPSPSLSTDTEQR